MTGRIVTVPNYSLVDLTLCRDALRFRAWSGSQMECQSINI